MSRVGSHSPAPQWRFPRIQRPRDSVRIQTSPLSPVPSHFPPFSHTNREAASRCPTFKLWRFYPVITSLQNIYKHAPCFRWVLLMSKNNIAWNQPQFLLLLWTKCSSVSRVYFFFVITIFFFFSWFWRQGVICCPLLSDSAHCKSSQILFWSSQEVSLWAGVCHNNGELVMRNKIAAITF